MAAVLYTSSSPSPRRVEIYLAEKGLGDAVERLRVDLRSGEQHREGFARRNPNRTVPVLELEDGTCIGESLAICRYFEVLHPEPPLFGTDAKDRALVEMWNRRVELDGLRQTFHILRNRTPAFEDRALPGWREGMPQIPALVERSEKILRRLLGWLDEDLSNRPFVAGERFTVADITLAVTFQTAERLGVIVPSTLGTPLQEWWERVSARPSMVS